MSKPNRETLFNAVSRRWVPIMGLAMVAVCLCLMLPHAAQASLATNLQLHSTMNSYTPYTQAAYWEDVSGNDHVTLVDALAYDGTGDTNGTNRGTAVDLSGGNVRLTVLDGLNTDFDPGTGDCSISFWYNSISSDSCCLLSKGSLYSGTGGFSFRTSSGVPLIRMNDVNEGDGTKASISSGLGDLTGTGWHHLVGIFDRSGTYSAANTVSFYVDNTLAGSTVLNDVDIEGTLYPYSVSNAASEFLMGGQDQSSTAYNIKGYMDDVAVYRGVLSTSDVNTLYTASSLDASTVSGVTPVAIHNFVTNRDQDETFASIGDDYDGHVGLLAGTAAQVNDATRGNVIEVVGDAGSGGDNYVTYGDVLDPGSTSYTVSYWFKLNDGDTSRNLVSKGMNYSSGDGGWSTGFSATDNAIYFRANHGDDTHRLNIKKVIDAEDMDDFLSSWHHMTAIINQESGYIQAYLDGEGSGTDGTANGWQLTTTSYFATFTSGESFETDTTRDTPVNDLTIGGTKSGGNPMNGRVDDLAIWTRALTESEVLGIYSGDWIPEAIPGDTNGDCIVNETDATTVASNWGLSGITGGASEGDFNGDGSVDAKDASIMAAHWGNHNNESEGAAVPEPSALLLIGLGLMMISSARRRTYRD